MAEDNKTYITEANMAMIGIMIAYVGVKAGLDMPPNVVDALVGLVGFAANIGIRVLSKKGLI